MRQLKRFFVEVPISSCLMNFLAGTFAENLRKGSALGGGSGRG